MATGTDTSAATSPEDKEVMGTLHIAPSPCVRFCSQDYCQGVSLGLPDPSSACWLQDLC